MCVYVMEMEEHKGTYIRFYNSLNAGAWLFSVLVRQLQKVIF